MLVCYVNVTKSVCQTCSSDDMRCYFELPRTYFVNTGTYWLFKYLRGIKKSFPELPKHICFNSIRKSSMSSQCGPVIEIGGLECALYCFAFVWYVIPMRSKDGSNTLAKECYGLCR